MNGRRCAGINELSVPFAALGFEMQWAVKRIDPLELVMLREEGLSMQEIAVRLGIAGPGCLRRCGRGGWKKGNWQVGYRGPWLMNAGLSECETREMWTPFKPLPPLGTNPY